jgi:Ca2+-binding RTX toxin-like protein
MTWPTKLAMLSTTILVAAGLTLVAGAPAQAIDACLAGTGSVITGTAGNDVLIGTDRDDVINGNGGTDQIFGMGGQDIISGGGGNDIIFGGDCTDLLMGGAGDDVMAGENGDDYIGGDAGSDTAYGGPGDNHCVTETMVPPVQVLHAYEYFGPNGGDYWGPACNLDGGLAYS